MMAERVLILRLGSMGDVLHALPAVAALRAAHPDAHIGWAIERRWTPFLVADGTPLAGPRSSQRPLVDRVHVVDTLTWRKAPFSTATWSDIRGTFRDLRAERYDLAIDFQGSIKSATVALLSGAPSRIGFASPREKPATMFYTRLVQPTGGHIIDQNLSLMSSAFPRCSSVTSVVNVFPHDPVSDTTQIKGVSRFAILNPGAGWPAKQWPAARYGEVARALREEGIFSAVNYGPGEKPVAQAVLLAAGDHANAASLPLASLIGLTRRATLFIGGDTGPMHLANAMGVPVVALFGPTDPKRNGPYFPHAVTLRHPSSRTDMSHGSEPDPGLEQITTEQVISAARELLKPGARRPEPAS